MIDHLTEYLLIKPGGRLFFMSGGMADEIFEKDVTDSITRVLPMQCRIDPQATLRDVLLLVKSKIDFFEDLIGHHCSEFVEEGLKEGCPPEPNAYLEIYWTADNSMGVLEGLEFPLIHEVVGENRDYTRCLGFVPTHQFSSLPIRLNHNAKVHIWQMSATPLTCVDHTFPVGFTLFQLLYGIFWELSFFSHPSNREQRAEEILGRIENIEDTNETTNS